MKKTFTILLTLVLVLGLLAGCGGAEKDTGHTKGGSASAAPETGTYLATYCEEDGEEFPCDEDWLVIEADGKGVLVFEGEEYAMEWELDGSAFRFEDKDGSTFEGTYADGVIEGSLDGSIEYIFELEGAEPEPEAAAELAEGTYLATGCVIDGEEYSCDEDWLVIEADGKGVLVFEGEEYAMEWETEGDSFSFVDEDGSTFEGTYAEGVIEGSLDGNIEYVFELAGPGTELPTVSSVEEEEEWDLYLATYCESEGQQCYCGNDWLMLYGNGEGVLVYEGDFYNFEWELSGSDFSFLVEEGSVFEGTWSGDVIEGVLNDDLRYTFALAGTEAALPAEGGPSAADMEPGTYSATWCESEGEEYYCDEDWLVIEPDGEGSLVFEGEEYAISWKLDGSDFFCVISGGVTFEGTYADGVIEGGMDNDLWYVFELGEDRTVPVSTGGPSAADMEPGTYQAISCVIDGEEYSCDEDWLEIEAAGEGVLVFIGEEYDMEWELDGHSFSFVDEDSGTFEGTYSDGVIEGVYSDVIEYVFELVDG